MGRTRYAYTFSCPKCDMEFDNLFDLNFHAKGKHGVIFPPEKIPKRGGFDEETKKKYKIKKGVAPAYFSRRILWNR